VRRAAIVALLAAGCGARPQWTISLVTDAQVPQFGDRVLVEILDASGGIACDGDGCRGVFGAGDPAIWPISFGVARGSDPAPRVRARLFRAVEVGPDGLPAGTALIDALGQLPDGGDPQRALVLSMSCFGVPSDPAAGTSCDPASGQPVSATTLLPLAALPEVPVGSWAPGLPAPCPSAPPAGMVCIQGGAFLLGGTHSFPFDDFSEPLPEHLVRLSPFALDADEFTVGHFRKLLGDGKVTGEPVLRDPDSKTADGACTWLGVDNGVNDALPLNCVDFVLATNICAAAGGELPSEAQWEYAAGDRSDESPYPWGGDADVCAHAVVGVGRMGNEGTLAIVSQEDADCRAPGRGWGPVAGGNPRDQTTAGVLNLAGNLSEWVADKVASYSDGCWTSDLGKDPVCGDTDKLHDSDRSYRGASWNAIPVSALTVTRGSGDGNHVPNIGFRCVKKF
jgi:formylglycine-generating enzyme required for sulfatase activity